MDSITVKKIEHIEPYAGEHAISGIRFRAVRQALGVSSWGMNVMELDPECSAYPEHDHASDGHEEVYVVLRGSATLIAGEQRWPLEAGALARVGPNQKRKIVAGPEGVQILALGGTPGKPYSPSLGRATADQK